MKRALAFIPFFLCLCLLCLVACGSESAETTTQTEVCNHSFGEWQTLSEPTCAVVGVGIRTCSLCGEVETRETPKNEEHQFGDWGTVTPSACNADGVKTHICTVCHATEDGVIPASKEKHIYGAWKVTADADCIHDGSRERICSVCSNVEKETIVKTGVHDYGSWETVKAATCAETGSKQRICKVCQDTESKTLEKTSVHTFGEVSVTEQPSYFKNGKGTHTCTVCQLTEDAVVPRTGKNVFLYEDFTGATFVADNQNAVDCNGLFLGTQGKGSIFQVEKVSNNDCLIYYSTLQGTDTQMNIELKPILASTSGKSLSDLLVDGKITFSFKAAIDATATPCAVEFYFRDDTGVSFSVLKINYEGKVTSNTLKMQSLSSTFTAYALTFDFKNNKVTGYVNGTKSGETTFNCPTSITNLMEWAKNVSVYFLNGKFTPSNGYEKKMYFDDFVLIGGDYTSEIYSAQ